MKQESIEAKQSKRKKESAYSAVVFVAIQLISVAVFAGLCLIPDMPIGVIVILLVLAGIDLLMIPTAIRVLKERMKEIEGGELDAAGKY